MELSTYFRINDKETGQFERTLIIAEEGSYVSYLEGCTAPAYSNNQLHAAVVELIAHENAQIKYSTVQNWYSGIDKQVKGVFIILSPNEENVLDNVPKFPGHRSKPVLPLLGNTQAVFTRG